MTEPQAAIIGVGDGLSVARARELSADYSLMFVAPRAEKMQANTAEAGARMVLMNATHKGAVPAVFDDLPEPPRAATDNASKRTRGPIAEASADDAFLAG